MFLFRSGALGLHGSDPPRTTLSNPTYLRHVTCCNVSERQLDMFKTQNLNPGQDTRDWFLGR